MAQKVQVILTDDLDGGEAEETMQFAIDGVTYEIDLSGANAAALRTVMEPYEEAARRLSGKRKHSRGVKPTAAVAPAKPSTESTPDPKAVRAWAAANGIEVSDRGRVARDVMARFLEAQ